MSDSEKMSESEKMSDSEYTPRKSKKRQIIKPQKKQKKYTPKSQKQNLIKTKDYKTFNTQVDVLHDNKDALLDLIEILNTENILKWDSNYEQLYKEYSLEEVEEYKKGYDNIHYRIREDYLKNYYNRYFWVLKNIY